MNWTPEQYNRELAKARFRQNWEGASQEPLGSITDEAELHEQIQSECTKRGWLALHGRMDQATGRTIGEPDFVIFAEHPAMFLIECKRLGGKLSPAQAALHAWAQKLGWQVHTVHSFEEFLSVIQNTP